MVIKMTKAIRMAGGILKIDGSKMYSPEFREHLTPGRFVIRYPKRGDDHDKDKIESSNRVSRTG